MPALSPRRRRHDGSSCLRTAAASGAASAAHRARSVRGVTLRRLRPGPAPVGTFRQIRALNVSSGTWTISGKAVLAGHPRPADTHRGARSDAGRRAGRALLQPGCPTGVAVAAVRSRERRRRARCRRLASRAGHRAARTRPHPAGGRLGAVVAAVRHRPAAAEERLGAGPSPTLDRQGGRGGAVAPARFRRAVRRGRATGRPPGTTWGANICCPARACGRACSSSRRSRRWRTALCR